VIFTHAGDDCTDIFTAFHPVSALKSMETFEIGELDETIIPPALLANKLKPEKQKEFEKAYRTLRAKIFAMGLFNASAAFYTKTLLINLSILAVAVYLASFKSFVVNMVGASILGLFFQQSGWLAHDYTHHQVCKDRTRGDTIALFVMNVCQGFSLQWWKSKHNAHHAVPNLHASCEGASDGDPDIDTMPFLAWTLKMAESAQGNSFGNFMITWQAFFYFPLLLLARLSWAHQSWVFVFGGYGQHSVKGAALDQKKMVYPTAEKVLLVVHYAFYFLILRQMPFFTALAYFLVSQTSCGLYLALVFGLGHNGMAVYPADQRPDFWKLQVSTTRNITGGWFMDWFCGGLNYQVDHHLFPMLPRHNLRQVNALVKSFCKEQGVTYHEADIFSGNLEVLVHLSKVSAEFIREFPAM